MTIVRPTPARIVAIAIGIPVLLAAVGDGTLTATGMLARSSEKHTVSYPWHGGTLSLDNDDGSVAVRHSSATSTVSVTYTEHYGLKKPHVEGRNTNGGVQLSAGCSGFLFQSFCSVDYVVSVPTGAAVKVHTGDGRVALDGVDGSIDVRAGDGAISGKNLTSPRLSVGCGDGSVSLQWRSAPTHVEVSIGDGSLNIAVPADSGPYAITRAQGDGSTDIAVAEDPRATRSMVLRLGDGSLAVRTPLR